MAEHGLDEVASKLIDRSNKVIGQLGSWILLGNAAGIGFILATARDGKLPASLPVDTVYITFLVGLVCAFFGYLFNAAGIALVGAAATRSASAFVGLNHRLEMRKLLNDAGKEIPASYEEDDRRDEAILAQRLPPGFRPFVALGLLFFAVSVGALGFGLSLPLFYGLS